MKYFAYGSNLSSKRFKKRVPSGVFECIASLNGYKLKFHVKDEDDSAKSNAFKTGDPSDKLLGVVYDIEATEKNLLDRAEDLGNEYVETQVFVQTDEGDLEVFMYIAKPDLIDEAVIPYTWYKEFIVQGAKEHHFSENYIEELEKVVSKEDPDRERAEKNSRIQLEVSHDEDFH